VTRSIINRYGVVIMLVAVFAFFSLLRPSTFPTLLNVKNILETYSLEMIVALGLTVVLAMGDFDLSVASTASMAGGGALAEIYYNHLPWAVAVLLMLVIVTAAGMLKGYLVAVLGGNSFIMTLALTSVLLGVEYAFTSEVTIFGAGSPAFLSIASGSTLGFNNDIWFALGVAIVLWVLLDATEIGRFMYAIGGNAEAARLSGIRVRRIRTIGFVIVSLAAALAGLLTVSQGGQYQENFATYMLIPGYAGAFVGAACFRPGEFNIPGTIVGVLLLGTISTGLVVLNLQNTYIQLADGAILIVAVLGSTLAARRS
jgi:ribose transport system permease protein